MIILEQANEVELGARCAEHLRRDHSIPADRVADIVLQLRAVIAVCRRGRKVAMHFSSSHKKAFDADPRAIRFLHVIDSRRKQ